MPIQALARTYNQADTGTFGQYYPALRAVAGDLGQPGRGAAAAEEERRVPRQRRLPEPRSATPAPARSSCSTPPAPRSATTRTLTAAGDKYIQEDDIFTKAGAGTQDVAYARVQAMTAGCKAWFFASVVDAVTNDPTTVPQQSCPPRDRSGSRRSLT